MPARPTHLVQLLAGLQRSRRDGGPAAALVHAIGPGHRGVVGQEHAGAEGAQPNLLCAPDAAWAGREGVRAGQAEQQRLVGSERQGGTGGLKHGIVAGRCHVLCSAVRLMPPHCHPASLLPGGTAHVSDSPPISATAQHL